MAKRKLNPDQMPLLTPDSDWVRPTELPDWRSRGIVAIDLETKDNGLAEERGPGWAYKDGFICGAAMAIEGRAVYAPITHPDSDNFDKDAVQRWLKDHIETPTLRKVFQNGAYDMGWMQADMGIAPPDDGTIEDTQAAAVLIDENRLTYNLNDLCEWQGIPGKDEKMLREAAFDYGVAPKSGIYRIPARYVGPYGEQDAAATLQLFQKLEEKIRLEGVFEAYRLECDLLPCTIEMRRRGIRIDLDKATQAKQQILSELQRTIQELSDLLGHNISIDEINSARRLQHFFDQVGVGYPRTATNLPSFSKDWMKDHEHWLPRLVTRIGALDDAANKFLQGFIINFCHKGRLHAEIHQTRSDDGGTRSHRFSYANPPLQQMPNRDAELASLIRGVFVPDHGKWLGADYSQQEYRLIVHYAALLELPKADEAAQRYISNPRTDFHSMVAEMTGLDRKPAKDTNFAKSFGAGPAKFASMIGKSIEEAKAIMDQYDRELPFNKELSKVCNSRAAKLGYIKLIDGARSHFDHWEPSYYKGDKYFPPVRYEEAMKRINDRDHPWHGLRLRRAWTHKAMNRLIQGSAARQTKIAMLQCWRERIVPLIQMHDELGFDITEHRTGQRVTEIMVNAVKLVVPVVVDEEYGPNWGKAKYSWEECPNA